MIREIIYESHSTSEDNEKGVASGHCDPPLSVKGKQQAAALGTRYSGVLPEIILCSDLKRSYETAQIAFPNIPTIKTQLLREWNYGLYNGRPIEELEKLKPSHIYTSFPEGESLQEAIQRVLGFIDSQLGQCNNKKIMIVAHRSTFYALEHRYKNCLLESLVTAPWTWQAGWKYLIEER